MSASMPEDVQTALEELAAGRKSEAQWRKYNEDRRKVILAWAESEATDVGLTASGAPGFHFNRIPGEKLDKDKLRAKFPDVFEECTEETETVRLEIDLDA